MRLRGSAWVPPPTGLSIYVYKLLLVCSLTEATGGPGGLGILHLRRFGEQIREVLFVSFTAGIHRSSQTPYTASGLKSHSGWREITRYCFPLVSRMTHIKAEMRLERERKPRHCVWSPAQTLGLNICGCKYIFLSQIWRMRKRKKECLGGGWGPLRRGGGQEERSTYELIAMIPMRCFVY